MAVVLAACFCGCATAVKRSKLEIIDLHGRRYVALDGLCSTRGLQRQYDALTHRVMLSRLQTAPGSAGTTVSMAIGEKIVLVDGQPRLLKHPVELFENSFLVPEQFARDLETLFGGQVCIPVRTANAFSKVHTIAIDAGHGGKDPGAISRSGLREKEVTLDIVKRLKPVLEAQGARVILVRDRDRFIPLEERSEIAEDARADLFVSIHVNANRRRSVNGFEVYSISSKVSDSQRAVLSLKKSKPRVNGLFAGQPSKALQTTLWDMVHTYNRGESKELSRLICKQARCDLDMPGVDSKSANFSVLRETALPAVLVEVGYLSNPREEKLLRDGSYRQSVAESVARGIAAYAAERV